LRARPGSARFGPEVVDDVAEEVARGEKIPPLLGSPPYFLLYDGRVDPEDVAVGSGVPEGLSVVLFGHDPGDFERESRKR
jgi:hypothetical protein